MPIIGREPPADIVIPLPEVSSVHASIRHIGGEWYELRDLGSTNGTFVNGQRIRTVQIRLTDQIGFGAAMVDLRAYAHLIPQGDMSGSATAAFVAPALPRMPPPMAPPPYPMAPPPMAMPPYGGMPPAYPPRGGPGMGTDLAAALAAQRSFIGPAFLTWLLYACLWFPGLIEEILRNIR
ncbi:MAG: FHA domain-containing protein [Vicinamibacteria bacterium]|nr:FHA domain-containing protein [Vicinamibacteria bacterium]